MSEVSICSSGRAARAASSFFCFPVRARGGIRLMVTTLLRLGIYVSLAWGSLACRDDADYFLIFIHRVGHNYHANSAHHSNRLPARFAVYLPVLHTHMIRIVKHQDGGCEADAMFSLIDPVLALVPGELHRQSLVMTNMYIQYSGLEQECKRKIGTGLAEAQ